jgi:hypothetical protein
MIRNTRTRRRPGRRAAFAAGLVLAVGLGVSTQAAAQTAATSTSTSTSATTSTKPAATPRSITGFNGEGLTEVADFFGAYVDAKDDYPGPDTALAKALRTHYLTPAFAKRLKAWEKKNKVDGVLRAQNVPVDWTVTEGRNSREIAVTHAFGGGETPSVWTRLVVKLEPVYGDVTDIRTRTTH